MRQRGREAAAAHHIPMDAEQPHLPPHWRIKSKANAPDWLALGLAEGSSAVGPEDGVAQQWGGSWPSYWPHYISADGLR